MIRGVGIDVVDIARFADTLARTPRLAVRLFTAAELELPAASLAARFAAKEALAKSLGAPAGLRWLDVEIPPSRGKPPVLRVRGSVAAAAAAAAVARFEVSLSHDAGIASAVVIAAGMERDDVRPVFAGRASTASG
jgi:holo-[acyl-carrier protein] synthase